MKKIGILLLVLAMLVSAAACTSTQGSSENTTTTTKATETAIADTSDSTQSTGDLTGTQADLRIIWWGSQTRHEYTQAAIDVFTGIYPGIKITPEFVSWDGYWEKLSTMASSKSLPDIIQQDYKYIAQYEGNNLIIDMLPYVDSGIINLDDCAESTWNSGILNDKLIALNLGMNSLMTMIDKEMFDKAGITIPDDTWTYDDYVDIMDQLVAKKDELGIDFADQTGKNQIFELASAWLREKGMFFYNQDGSESFGFEKEAGKAVLIELLNFEKDNVDTLRTSPLAVREETDVNGPESGSIVKGQAAVDSANWSNQAKAISNAAGKNFVLIGMPSTDGNKKMQYMKPSQFFSITSDSKTPEAAAIFINEFTNNIDMNLQLKGERGVPISDVVRDALAATFTADSIERAVFDYVGRIAKTASPIPAPEPKANAAIMILVQNMLKNVVDGGMDPDAAFEDFYAQALVEFEMAE